MAILRIQHALLWTGEGNATEPDGALEAIDGRISYVGSTTALPPPDPSAEVIDAKGLLLMPGLVNAHTHLAMTLFRGYADDMPLQTWLEQKIWPVEMKLTGDDVYWGSLLGVVEMLRAGITCYNDMYHHFEDGTRAAIDGGIRALPSGVLLGFVGDPLANLQKAVEFSLSFCDNSHNRIHPMLGPHAPYTCPDDLLRAVVDQAREHNLPIHIHLAETQHEVEESLAMHGTTPVQHLNDLGLLECQVSAAHCVHLTEADIALLTDKQVGCVHCPGSNMKLASGFAPVPQLLKAGAIVALGTDGAASNNNLDLLEEARLAALIHKGHCSDPTVISAYEALQMATSGGARAVGLGDQIGTLTVGKRADCILVDLSGPHNQPLFDPESQLVYAAQAGDVDTVIVEGKVLLRGRQFTHLDEQEIIKRTQETVDRLMAR